MKHEFDNFTVYTPENYTKPALPFFNEWLADLRTNPPQTRGTLQDSSGHCCLARLSLVQGRLTSDGRDGQMNNDLDTDNPCFPWLARAGYFPQWCYVQDSVGKKHYSFAGCNDDAKLTMVEIADVLETLYQGERILS